MTPKTPNMKCCFGMERANVWAHNHQELGVPVPVIAQIYLAGFTDGSEQERGVYGSRRKLSKAISEAEVEKLRQEYVPGGLTTKELAYKYGCSEQEMHYVLQKNGIRKRIKWDRRSKDYLLTHYNVDKTAAELASHYKVSKKAVVSAYNKFKEQ